jgi:hypothetical protein
MVSGGCSTSAAEGFSICEAIRSNEKYFLRRPNEEPIMSRIRLGMKGKILAIAL